MNLNLGLNKLLIVLFVCIIYCIQPAKAQSVVTFDVSQVFSTFRFIDSDGNKDDDYSSNIVNAYNLGYQFSEKNGLMYGVNIGLRKAGASKEINDINFNWNLQYAEAKIGIGYMLKKWRFRPYILLSPYYGGLLKGSQVIDEKSYDVMKGNYVAKSDYGLITSIGLNVRLSKHLSAYSCYNHIYGIKNIETTASQHLFNRGFSLSLGIALTITKTSPKWIQQ